MYNQMPYGENSQLHTKCKTVTSNLLCQSNSESTEYLSQHKQQSLPSADLQSIVKFNVINNALHLNLDQQPVGCGRSCEPLFAHVENPHPLIVAVIGRAQTNTL